MPGSRRNANDPKTGALYEVEIEAENWLRRKDSKYERRKLKWPLASKISGVPTDLERSRRQAGGSVPKP